MRYSFIRTYKPVLDDALYRSWDSTAEYRAWCEGNLPSWLGYGRVLVSSGIERFEDAWRRRVEIEGFPVCHLDDIIASKTATNRTKDRESLPRLRSFRDWWTQQPRAEC